MLRGDALRVGDPELCAAGVAGLGEVHVESLHGNRSRSAGGAPLADRGDAGLTLAAVVCQVAEQLVHAGQRRAVMQIAPLALDRDQISVDQLLEVKGERRGWNVQGGGQGTGRHARGTGAHQGTKYPQARFLCQSSQGGDGGLFIHNSKIIEQWVKVKLDSLAAALLRLTRG